MGLKVLLGWALHLWIASSLVLNPPQSFDASSNTSAIQLARILSKNSQSSISSSTSSLSLTNTTALAGNASLPGIIMACNGASFTTPGPASYASCWNAFRKTAGGGYRTVMTFGDRAVGNWENPLPIRFMDGKTNLLFVSRQMFELSWTPDDGNCVIDYDVAEPGQVDHISPYDLYRAAKAVLGTCVLVHNRGGVVIGLGSSCSTSLYSKNHRLAARLR